LTPTRQQFASTNRTFPCVISLQPMLGCETKREVQNAKCTRTSSVTSSSWWKCPGEPLHRRWCRNERTLDGPQTTCRVSVPSYCSQFRVSSSLVKHLCSLHLFASQRHHGFRSPRSAETKTITKVNHLLKNLVAFG
jgi:hypothetical protein